MAPHVNTMAPLLGIEPHSSPLAKQFYQSGEPIHGLTTDLGLMHQHTVERFEHVPFHHCRYHHLGKFPFVSIRDFLQNYNVSNPKVSFRNQPLLPFL